MNKVEISGLLGKDPVLTIIPSGKSVTKFSIANKLTKDSKEVSWFNIICWEDLAVFANEELKKGDLVKLAGFITSRSYTDKKNTRVYVVEIIAKSLEKIEKKTKVIQPTQQAQTPRW